MIFLVFIFIQGGVVMVTHDERLVRAVCKEVWMCSNGSVIRQDGGFDQYRKLLEDQLRDLWANFHRRVDGFNLMILPGMPCMDQPKMGRVDPGVIDTHWNVLVFNGIVCLQHLSLPIGQLVNQHWNALHITLNAVASKPYILQNMYENVRAWSLLSERIWLKLRKW